MHPQRIWSLNANECIRNVFPSVSIFFFPIHTQGDFVVLASDPHRLIGVDVMDARRPLHQNTGDFFRVMQKQFTPREWGQIRAPWAEPDQLVR
jgi:hypothetical protein